jgi:hypothetical protein
MTLDDDSGVALMVFGSVKMVVHRMITESKETANYIALIRRIAALLSTDATARQDEPPIK